MSATRQPKRTGNDIFLTPPWCVRAILPALSQYLPPTDELSVLEPAAGEGAIVKQLASWRKCVIDCYEIRDECRTALQSTPADLGHVDHVSITNFLERPSETRWRDYSIVITNPPYRLAMEFIQHALEYIHVDGIVAVLLRLGFLASQGRQEWLARHMPDIHVLGRRPSFTGSGTDASDYGWFIFRKYQRTAGVVRPLNCKDEP